MARNVRMIRTTLADAVARGGHMDRKKVLATTDEDIDRQCAEDEDLVPDATRLGPPLPDLKRIRDRLGLSQDAFAKALGIPAGTIRNWEQRRTLPDPAAISLLRVVEREPATVFRALGVKVAVKKATPSKQALA